MAQPQNILAINRSSHLLIRGGKKLPTYRNCKMCIAVVAGADDTEMMPMMPPW